MVWYIYYIGGAIFDTLKTTYELNSYYIPFIPMFKLFIPFSKGVIFDTLGVLFLTPFTPSRGVIFDTLFPSKGVIFDTL